MVRALFLFVAVLGFEVLGAVAATLLGLDMEVVGYGCAGAGACLCMAAMGWQSLVVPRADALLSALRKGWWLLVASLLFMLFDLVALITEETPVADAWPLLTLRMLFICAMIGLVEECMFRGLLLGGLLSVPRRSSMGIATIVVIASLLFGAAHVDWFSLDYANYLSVVQAVLKIVQTGILGFFFASLVIRTGSVAGVSMLHGLSDFLLVLVSGGLIGQSLDFEYVTTGSEAYELMVVYLFAIALYMPLAIIGARMLKGATKTPFDQE